MSKQVYSYLYLNDSLTGNNDTFYLEPELKPDLKLFDEDGDDIWEGYAKQFLKDNSFDEETKSAIETLSKSKHEEVWFGGGAQPRTRLIRTSSIKESNIPNQNNDAQQHLQAILETSLSQDTKDGDIMRTLQDTAKDRAVSWTEQNVREDDYIEHTKPAYESYNSSVPVKVSKRVRLTDRDNWI